ncbi:MAG: carbon starvation protein A [candidate division WOR-3 bacterium]|nr:MAG: carbon starvation protein A [candidate division WOR-3 bacterium]
MNALFLAVIAFLVFLCGYLIYGRLLERLFRVDPKRKTPAHSMYDGRDYVPAKHWMVLFGHHFASIAGAGPILGPVIAVVIWGWGPAVLWIFFGSIFIGGVHDFAALMISIRERGRSVANIAQSTLGSRSKLIFGVFLWLTLVLVIAVFAASAAKTLQTTPSVVIPTFGLLLVALFVGLMTYKWNVNLLLSSLLGIVMLFCLIFLGYLLPIQATFTFWLLCLFGYAFLASVLPVNILLQPRDYLASFVLFFGLLFGYVGLFITRPQIHAPFFISWDSASGSLWPMMFVIIACGAISGFHSLVASGTTAKQLGSERDARRIGYGAMLAEGLLAILAVLAVTAGLYWKGGPEGLVYPELMKGGNWIKTFGTGYGEIVKPIFHTFGMLLGITMLKTFIMTTLDSATRIARYLGEELFGDTLGIGFFKNRYFNTAVIIGFALWLSLGSWQSIWPVFGAANQLVAALTLFVLTTWLLSKSQHIKYSLYPALFMLLTTLGALFLQISQFMKGRQYMLTCIAAVLVLLALFMVIEVMKVVTRYVRGGSGVR